jgi:cullin-4
MQEKMEDVLKKSFGNQDSFRVTLKSSFENFINLRQNKPAELLAKFVDKKMRGEKGLNDGDVEVTLDKVRRLVI